MLAGTLTVVQDKLHLPIPWDQTSQYVELAASSLALCRHDKPFHIGCKLDCNQQLEQQHMLAV